MSHRLFWCPHVPWSPWNMSYGALTTCPMEFSQHVPWSPSMEPYNMSHGALQHVPWSLRNCPMEPSTYGRYCLRFSIGTLAIPLYHTNFGMGWDISTAVHPAPLYHVGQDGMGWDYPKHTIPLTCSLLSRGALAVKSSQHTMEPSQHVTRSLHMSHAWSPTTCPMDP